MKNIITVSLPFSFKGKELCPRSTIDLDEEMESGGIPCLYTHIANENGISPYSYEHDVMMMAELVFEGMEGAAKAFIHDGIFDVEGFEAKWKQQKLEQSLHGIANRHLGSDNTDARLNSTLKGALLEAYELGREAGRVEATIQSTTDPLF